MIEVLKKDPDGWWTGKIDNKIGYFPNNYAEVIDEVEEKTLPLPSDRSKLSAGI